MDWSIVIPAIIAAVVSITGAVVSYRLASKRMSGDVGTSTADQLWAESKSIRDDYQRRLVLADKRATELEKELLVLEEQVRGLTARLRDMRKLLKLHGVTADNGENGA